MDFSIGPVVLVIGAALLLFIGLGIPARRANVAERAAPPSERSSSTTGERERT